MAGLVRLRSQSAHHFSLLSVLLPAPHKDLTLAFAGVFQSATLVHQLARLENYDSAALHHASFSLLRINSDSTAEIFGSVHGVRLGLDCVARLFGGQPDSSMREVFQYAVGMYQLSLKLRQNHRGREMIEEGLNELRDRHLKHYRNLDHDNPLHEDIALLYARSISYMTPRIMVQGSRGRLENPLTANRVRTALFAGIRAAWLWHQLGGRRWHLLFQRTGYQRQARRLLGQRRLG